MNQLSIKAVLGFVLSVLVLKTSCVYPKSDRQEVFHWKKIEYENLPQPDNSWVGPYKYHIPENNDLISVGYHPISGLMVVTFYRCRPGVPINVGAFCVQDYKYGSSPKIWAFPNNKLNTLQTSDFAGGSEEEKIKRASYKSAFYQQSPRNSPRGEIELKRIISTFHIHIDEKCNRLFLADNGVLQYYQNATYNIQKSALVVIELPSNGCTTRSFPIIRRSEFPDKIIGLGQNGLMYVFLDYKTENSCNDLFVYMTNPFYNYLVVYDYKKDKFWSFSHETYQPIIAESNFIYDETYAFYIPLGLMSITLSYPDENGYRTAYYNAFASTAQYAVSTEVLQNKRLSPNNFNPMDFKIMGYRMCNHQVGKTAIDYNYGVVFYAEVQSDEISCWNINKPFNPDNIGVVYKSDKIFFISQIFIDSQGYVWFHSCHGPTDLLTDIPLNLQEVNSRTFRLKVSDAIKGTVCEN